MKKLSIKLTAFFMLGFIFSCSTMAITPAHKLSQGPLFFFMKPDCSGNKKKNILYVIDQKSSLTPQPMASSKHPYIRVKAKLSQDLFLLDFAYDEGGLFLCNIDNGNLKKILPNSQTGLVSVEKGKIFFTGYSSESEDRYKLYVTPTSAPLNTGSVCSETIISILLSSDNYFWLILDNSKPELWRVSKDGTDKKKIIDIPPQWDMSSTLLISGDYFWFILGDTKNELWRVSKDGLDKKKIIDIPSEWYIPMLNVELSPNGKLLALGVANTNNDNSLEQRDLIIVDTEKSTIVYEYKRINVEVCHPSNTIPSLNFIWLNNETIRFSETAIISQTNRFKFQGYFQWVDLEIATGKRLLEQKYGAIGSSHEYPSKDTLIVEKPLRRTEGFFDVQWDKLFFKGEPEPIACIHYNKKGFSSEFAVCPGGEWATYICYEDSIVYLVNGKDKTKKKIAEGYCYALFWLPGIE